MERFLAEQARPPQGEEDIDRLLAYYLTFKEREYADEGRSPELYESLEYALKPIHREFGRLRVRDVSAELVREFCRKLRFEGKRDGSIRKYLAVFRAALNRCKKEGIYLGEIPGFDLPTAGPPRKDILTEDQFRHFMATEAAPHIDLFCLLMANTLKRPGAILQLQWSWGVDFNTGLLDFQPPDLRETTKRRTPTPMNPVVKEALLEAWDFATLDYVIEFNGKPISRIKKGFKTKAIAAGLPWITPYILRHTGASLLSMRGVPLSDIAEMMGSDEATVRKHYRKFQPDYLLTASNALESLYLGPDRTGPDDSAQICAQTSREETQKGQKPAENADDETEKMAENRETLFLGNDGVGSSILLGGTTDSAGFSGPQKTSCAQICALTPFLRLRRLQIGRGKGLQESKEASCTE